MANRLLDYLEASRLEASSPGASWLRVFCVRNMRKKQLDPNADAQEEQVKLNDY